MEENRKKFAERYKEHPFEYVFGGLLLIVLLLVASAFIFGWPVSVSGARGPSSKLVSPNVSGAPAVEIPAESHVVEITVSHGQKDFLRLYAGYPVDVVGDLTLLSLADEQKDVRRKSQATFKAWTGTDVILNARVDMGGGSKDVRGWLTDPLNVLGTTVTVNEIGSTGPGKSLRLTEADVVLIKTDKASPGPTRIIRIGVSLDGIPYSLAAKVAPSTPTVPMPSAPAKK